ncbi:MAG: response regulator transcription factor [Chloroflexota bacterium]
MNAYEKPSYSILVIDDHVLFRDGLASLFQSTPDFHVVDQAGSVKEGVEKAFHHRPDIILMDFSLPDGTGLDATRIILEELPGCKIIFLTVFETDDNLLMAIRLGAKGYMLKNVSSSSLISSLRALSLGEIAMSRKMMSKVLEYSRTTPLPPSNNLISKLSPREIDILAELEDGVSNMEIAQKLFLSENTVKHHIHSVLEKLGVENRRQAGEIARQVGVKKNRLAVAKK